MKIILSFAAFLVCWIELGLHVAKVAQAVELDRGSKARPIAADSDLSRWRSGQVFFDGQWRHIEQIQELVTTDPRWQEYQQRADTLTGSIEGHVELANWCQRNGLHHEEKLHWLYVLQADPHHRAALKGLGLIYYHEQLYPIDQLAKVKEQAKAAQQALKRYKPQFLVLVRATKSGSDVERKAALAELAAVTDPAAIPALAEVTKLEFGNADSPPNQSETAQKKPIKIKLQQAAIKAMSNMKEHVATQRLLEIAILSPYPEIRRSAAEALIPRNKTSYVPFLMSKLASPLEAEFNLSVSPSGVVRLTERIAEIGPEADLYRTRFSKYLTKSQHVIDREETQSREIRTKIDHQRDRNNAIRKARQTQTKVSKINQHRKQWNNRISEVLQVTTGYNYGDNPQGWWELWRNYNELEYSKDRPTYSHLEHEEDINYSSDYKFVPVAPPPVQCVSCFPAGTLVWTQSGSVPIESIQIGDLVLSQDPITGCLDYRPVLNTTVRDPSPTMKLDFNDESIVATRGHRFWVIGNGWRMAKHLAAGSQLHGVDSDSDLVSVSEGEKAVAYNLVVGDFHTYFVGKNRLLVHDNGCPRPTTVISPGIEPLANADR